MGVRLKSSTGSSSSSTSMLCMLKLVRPISTPPPPSQGGTRLLDTVNINASGSSLCSFTNFCSCILWWGHRRCFLLSTLPWLSYETCTHFVQVELNRGTVKHNSRLCQIFLEVFCSQTGVLTCFSILRAVLWYFSWSSRSLRSDSNINGSNDNKPWEHILKSSLLQLNYTAEVWLLEQINTPKCSYCPRVFADDTLLLAGWNKDGGSW